MTSRRLPPGIVDSHVHSAPDAVPRLLDDVEIATAAQAHGYRAVVLKSHHTVTAARAQIAERTVGGIEVLGGVALNLHSTGGLNPYAVDAAIRLGARIVWLPTFTSASQLRDLRRGGGDHLLRALGDVREEDAVEVLDSDGQILPGLAQCLDLIAAGDVTLATGHLSAREIMAVVPEARRRGVKRIVVTHPELSCVGLGLQQQAELAALGGVWFERVYGMTLPHIGLPMATIAEAARTIGVETTLMATDLGQAINPAPVDGMADYIEGMRAEGMTSDDIEMMCCTAPAAAMGLQPA